MNRISITLSLFVQDGQSSQATLEQYTEIEKTAEAVSTENFGQDDVENAKL